MRKVTSGQPKPDPRVRQDRNVGSIWPKQILSPDRVRLPGRVPEDAVAELNASNSPYQAEVSPERRGENDPQGMPTTRRDLTLIMPTGTKRTVATVEYAGDGYPAKLILGERDFVYLSVASEEELVDQLMTYFASLRLAA